jgi:hypothetical protein
LHLRALPGHSLLAEPVDKNDPKSVRKLRRIAEKLVECAMKGEGWAISQVADRIDGRPKQESDFSIASTRYVVEVPPQLSHEEWEKKYALPTAQLVQVCGLTIEGADF